MWPHGQRAVQPGGPSQQGGLLLGCEVALRLFSPVWPDPQALTSHPWPEKNQPSCNAQKQINQSGSCAPVESFRRIISRPNCCFFLHIDGTRIFIVLLGHCPDELTNIISSLQPPPVVKMYLRCSQRGSGAVYHNTLSGSRVFDFSLQTLKTLTNTTNTGSPEVWCSV